MLRKCIRGGCEDRIGIKLHSFSGEILHSSCIADVVVSCGEKVRIVGGVSLLENAVI